MQFESQYTELQRKALSELQTRALARQARIDSTFVIPVHWELNKTRDKEIGSIYNVVRYENDERSINGKNYQVTYYTIGQQTFSRGQLMKKSENIHNPIVYNPISGTYMFVPELNRIYRVTSKDKDFTTRKWDIASIDAVKKIVQRIGYIQSAANKRYSMNNLANPENLDSHIPQNQPESQGKTKSVPYGEISLPDYANMTDEQISELA